MRRFIELAWNQGDEEAAQTQLAPAFAHHDLVTYAESDATGYLRSISRLRSAFSSIEFQIHDAIAEGGRVATRWTAVGVHRASGADIRIDGISIDRVVDRRIVENWTAWDLAGLQRQLPGLLASEGTD